MAWTAKDGARRLEPDPQALEHVTVDQFGRVRTVLVRWA
jgi:hypothetical protein